MELKILKHEMSICKLGRAEDFDWNSEFFFFAKTEHELSLVCPTEQVPPNTVQREDGWSGFYVSGTLDFSLVGILSQLSGILAANQISIFAVSTYDTDYILLKQECLERAVELLQREGYTVA